MVNGQWWKFDYFTVAVVGLLTNNRSWRHAYPLLKLYCFNASHVGQKTNMGFRWLSDLVNGRLVNCQWGMVKIRPSCCFKTIILINPAHYQFSVFNFQLNWPAHYQFSVINYPFSDALLNSNPSPPQPAYAVTGLNLDKGTGTQMDDVYVWCLIFWCLIFLWTTIIPFLILCEFEW